MQLHVADVAHAGQVHDHALKAETEARVTAAAVAAQVEIPPVVFLAQTELLHALGEQVEPLLTLAAADDLADARHEAVRRGDGLAVVIHAHIKRLDVLRVIRDEHGLVEHLLGQVALVLGLQVDAPLDGVVELVAGLLQQLHGVGIGDAAEVVVHDVVQALEQALIHEGVEKLQLLWAFFEHGVDDELHHRFHALEVVVEVGERHLRLDHPELGGVALGVGVLGAERRTEGVHVAEGEREIFGVELAGHGQVRALAEEILAEIDLAVVRARQIVEVERRDAEHLARALAVRARDDRGLHIDEAALLEERVHRLRRHAAHAERRAEEVRARTQMLDRAQKFHAVALFLQRIIRRGRALERDAVGLELERLLGVRREHELTVHDERRADVLAGDLVVIVELAALEHDLQALEAAAVVELDKAEILHVADRARPAADGQGLAAEGLRRCVDAGDVLSFSYLPPRFRWILYR